MNFYYILFFISAGGRRTFANYKGEHPTSEGQNFTRKADRRTSKTSQQSTDTGKFKVNFCKSEK